MSTDSAPLIAAAASAWFDAIGRFDPPARDFYERMRAEGYDPAAHIDVVPQLRILYIAVPKAATSTIESLLGSLMGRNVKTPCQAHKRRLSGLPGTAQMSRRTFFDIATGADSFRFTFVRNPYDWLVSCWLDKTKTSRCAAATPSRLYLAARPTRAETLSFPDFVSWAAETAAPRVNAHWALRDDLAACRASPSTTSARWKISMPIFCRCLHAPACPRRGTT